MLVVDSTETSYQGFIQADATRLKPRNFDIKSLENRDEFRLVFARGKFLLAKILAHYNGNALCH